MRHKGLPQQLGEYPLQGNYLKCNYNKFTGNEKREADSFSLFIEQVNVTIPLLIKLEIKFMKINEINSEIFLMKRMCDVIERKVVKPIVVCRQSVNVSQGKYSFIFVNFY